MSTAGRVAYFKGRIIPESEVLITLRDWFVGGYGCYDVSRTFDGRVFRLRQHLERLWRSLAYLRIDPPLPIDELEAISLEVARRNWDATKTDMWLTQSVSLGVPREFGGDGTPTLIVDSSPMPFAARAASYRDGIRLLISSMRRTPAWALSPRAKHLNRLNALLARREIESVDKAAWPMMLDEHGNLAESAGSNIFVVRDGKIQTPSVAHVLPGVSRQVAIELAEAAGLTLEERDVSLFEAQTADEIFLTSTSLCICPVSSINGQRVRNPAIPGPVTKQLQDAFARLVDFDFVAQYLSHLPEPTARP